MFTRTRVLIALCTFATSITGTIALATAAESAAATPESTIVLHNADARWTEALSTDLARFVSAGLEPISAEIHIWSADQQSEKCHGHAGYFSTAAGSDRVDICTDFHDNKLGEELRHNLVLHELAHAWIHANTVDSARDEFLSLRDAATWNDPGTLHPARGTEMAANTVMRALHPNQPSSDDKLCGFELLTGTSSPSDRHDPCADHNITD